MAENTKFDDGAQSNATSAGSRKFENVPFSVPVPERVTDWPSSRTGSMKHEHQHQRIEDQSNILKEPREPWCVLSPLLLLLLLCGYRNPYWKAGGSNSFIPNIETLPPKPRGLRLRPEMDKSMVQPGHWRTLEHRKKERKRNMNET